MQTSFKEILLGRRSQGLTLIDADLSDLPRPRNLNNRPLMQPRMLGTPRTENGAAKPQHQPVRIPLNPPDRADVNECVTKLDVSSIRTGSEIAELERASFIARERLPPDLATGQLVLNEETIDCDGPAPLRGIVDQVYSCPLSCGETLVPVDTKIRWSDKTNSYDVTQLSIYRYILVHGQRFAGTGKVVAYWGYIRAVNEDGQPTYKQVTLLPDSHIESLYARWTHLFYSDSVNEADFRSKESNCRKCSGNAVCARSSIRNSGSQ